VPEIHQLLKSAEAIHDGCRTPQQIQRPVDRRKIEIAQPKPAQLPLRWFDDN